MKTAIDWAIDTLTRAKLPPDISGDDLDRRMMELRILRNNGITEESLYCPHAGCSYVCTAPAGHRLDDPDATPVICPHDSTPLLTMTWKQMAEKLSVSMHRMESMIEEQKQAFVHMQELFNGLADKAMEAARRMQASEREAAELQSRMDDMLFLRDNERDELEWFREHHDGTAFRFAWRMIRELNENAHKGDWREWKPDKDTLYSEIGHHISKLMAAMDKGNRFAVDEFAADIGNYMVKATELYGQGLSQS